MSKIDHIGIATNSIEGALPFWEALGFESSDGGVVEDQGVTIRYLVNESDSRIELLEPTGSETPVGKFIQKKRGGDTTACDKCGGYRVNNREITGNGCQNDK